MSYSEDMALFEVVQMRTRLLARMKALGLSGGDPLLLLMSLSCAFISGRVCVCLVDGIRRHQSVDGKDAFRD